MQIKKIINLTMAYFILAGAFTNFAHANSLNVECEKRSNRSKISVNGEGLSPGVYIASIQSGTNRSISKNSQQPVNGEVEFDFDSNTEADATKIAASFIQDSVTGAITNTSTNESISISSGCKIKK